MKKYITDAVLGGYWYRLAERVAREAVIDTDS
jgi:hypothetical protein